MEIQVVSRNPQITDKVRDYAQKKIAKLERYLPAVKSAKVELALEQTKSAADRALVQVTLHCDGTILRAQDRSADFLSSIDTVSAALLRQINRFRARLYRSEQRVKTPKAAPPPPPAAAAAEDESARVVRRKRFPIKPMSPEEAIEEMELVAHDFYLFLNSETRQYNVVYRRKAGDFGLIEPEPM